MITVENLAYTYPGATQETLHGLNFEIAEREIFGFLGPSGAGRPPRKFSSVCSKNTTALLR